MQGQRVDQVRPVADHPHRQLQAEPAAVADASKAADGIKASPVSGRRPKRLFAKKASAAMPEGDFGIEGLSLKRVTICCGVASKAEGADVLVKRAEDALERARLFGPGRTGLDTGRSAA